MKFKELFEPVEKLDRYILRQYSKFVNELEKKGKNRYDLAKIANPLITISTIITAATLAHYGDKSNLIIDFPALALFMGMDISDNFHNSKRMKITDGSTTSDVPLYSRRLRFPVALTSAIYGIKGTTELVNYFKTCDGLYMMKSLEDFMTSAHLFALSSSMYIKDTNPKLLDKSHSLVEYLKRAGSKVKELVSPNPIPNPSPIQYYLLENRI
jgi:hypothetical protein